MGRREFLKKNALITSGLSVLGRDAVGAGLGKANRTMKIRLGAKRPNIVFIHIDDTAGANGCDDSKTQPELCRLI